MSQQFSAKQKQALRLLHGNCKHVLLSGGRRSGKSYLIISDMIGKALRFDDAKMLVGRSHLNHLVASIWDDTIPQVLKYYKGTYKLNQSDHTVTFYNGSKISLVGYDDKERIEKNLGREFCIVYNNECSTISYDAVLLAQSSLAQNIEGLVNKMYYDQNPPAPTHWVHKLFEEKVQPKTGDPLDRPGDYVSLLLNPMDNPYLSEDFMGILDALPERERRRYKFGEYVKVEGAVYDKFNLSTHSIELDKCPQFEYFSVGVDFGLNMAAVLVGFAGESVYILDEHTAYNSTASEFNSVIQYKWQQYSPICYCDPSGGERLQEIFNSEKADNAVEAGINHIAQKIENNQFYVVTKDGKPNCPQLVAEMDSYHYDNKGRIVKTEDHVVDATRYCLWSSAKFGGSILMEAS